MKYNLHLFLFSLLFLMSCRQERQQIENKQADINHVIENGDLVHLVLFNIKDSIALQEVVDQLILLKDIEVVKAIDVGSFKEMNDIRALSKYEVSLKVVFKDSTDYTTYQKHEIHLNLKNSLMPYLEGPPITYDYIVNYSNEN